MAKVLIFLKANHTCRVNLIGIPVKPNSNKESFGQTSHPMKACLGMQALDQKHLAHLTIL